MFFNSGILIDNIFYIDIYIIWQLNQLILEQVNGT